MTKRTAMRSYKKRRTLRKMKRTMRRKLQQRGGSPEGDLIMLILIIIPKITPLILQNFKIFYDILILIIQLSNGRVPSSNGYGYGYGDGTILGQGSRMGGSRRAKRKIQNQKGGIFKDRIIELVSRLNELKTKMTNDDAKNIIQYFINKFSTLPEPQQQQPVQKEQLQPVENLEELLNQAASTQAVPVAELTSGSLLERFNPMNKIKAITDKIKDIILASIDKVQNQYTKIMDTMIDRIRQRTRQILTADEINDINKLKTMILEEMKQKVSNGKDVITEIGEQVKSYINETASNLLSMGRDAATKLWNRSSPPPPEIINPLRNND